MREAVAIGAAVYSAPSGRFSRCERAFGALSTQAPLRVSRYQECTMMRKAQSPEPSAPDSTTMARWLAYLFLAGGAFALLAIALLPLPDGTDRTGSLALGLGAIAAGATVMALRRRLAGPVVPVLVAVGTLIVSAGTYFWGQRPTDDAMFYVWIALYAACFLGRTMATVQLGIIGIAYAAVLVAQGAGQEASTRWAVTMTTLAVAVAVISRLVRELRRAMARMEQVAADREGLLAKLETAALTDVLTALPNRRAWEAEIAREMARARRRGGPLSVALFDLDHFKAYNDRHGHRAGDELLRAAAAAWCERLRAADVLARYGGEEFAVLLPGCESADALALVERLREGTPPPCTVSAGVATWNGSEPYSDLLDRADGALYQAKANGRDLALLAATPEPTTT
jgi:diguanylate cyclase (GGDEF)-like protein